MRRSLPFLVAAVLVVPLMSACEGPIGPEGSQGAQGIQGPQGPAGPAGPAGQNAAETCTQCHKSDVSIFARQVQYDKSTHRLGGNFERSTTACAPCHTHQGFMERIVTGATSTATDILDPAPINCRTCHMIHQTFTNADYALTVSGPTDLVWNPSQGSVDFGDTGNLCASCHQGRTLNPTPVPGGANVTITSSRYGWHYSTQAQILAGKGAFAFGASASGPGAHGRPSVTEGTCGACHMGQAFGEQAGGHTFKMSYEAYGSERPNLAGCRSCHQTITTFDYNDLQTDVQALLDELATELRRVGVMRATSTYANTGSFPADVAAAFANWQMIFADQSLGVHNPNYVKGILNATIAKVKTY